MYDLKGPVGKNKVNHPSDVAFVQFVLKIVPGWNDQKIRTSFTGKIDGKWNDELGNLIENLARKNGPKKRIW